MINWLIELLCPKTTSAIGVSGSVGSGGAGGSTGAVDSMVGKNSRKLVIVDVVAVATVLHENAVVTSLGPNAGENSGSTNTGRSVKSIVPAILNAWLLPAIAVSS